MKIKKLILGLTSVGMFFLLILPPSLYAWHFRYGTMSWEPIYDNGTHVTIRLKMQNGWTASHGDFDASGDYSQNNGLWVSGFVGSIKNDYITVFWGDGDNDSVDIKILSRDTTTNDTISVMGVYASSTWTAGVTHTYPADNVTTEYTVFWGDNDREPAGLGVSNGRNWRNETKVNIGGPYNGNNSPVSAVPSVVQIQDNKTFKYQIVATDTDSDSLNYRWGTREEFFASTPEGTRSWDNVTYLKPGEFDNTSTSGMTLSSSGLVEWDISDSVIDNMSSTVNNRWVSVMMVEDEHDNGSVKSHIPIDFVFKIACAECEPPTIIGIPNTTQTVTIGDNKTFTFTATAITGAAPTLSVLNPPSDNSSIWSIDNSTSVVNGVNTTTFSLSFAPVSSMDNATYAINIRATDNASMTKDQSLGLKVSSISNAEPTAPTLVSPANGATVVKPVSFQWTKSTDADNDTISYSFYLCTDISFTGCSGTNVAAGINVIPPFNQNLQDELISWPRYLEAAPISQQISQDLSMIPKWLIMLTAFVLLSGLISFSLKNISHRKLVFILILLIFFFSLNINSCARSDNSASEGSSTSDESSPNTDNTTSSSGDTSTTATSVTINDIAYTTSDVTNTTYYWKVVASDPKGGSTASATWSFTVQ